MKGTLVPTSVNFGACISAVAEEYQMGSPPDATIVAALSADRYLSDRLPPEEENYPDNPISGIPNLQGSARPPWANLIWVACPPKEIK